MTAVLLWTAILVAAGLAWTLLWSDAKDRREAIRRAHSCPCGNPALPGSHNREGCDFR